MSGTDEKFSYSAIQEGLRIDLNIEMVYHAAHSHSKQVKAEHKNVDWKKYEDERKYKRFNYTFPGMEGKCCPRGGSKTVVMYFMHIFKNFGMMHPSVNPVIICFVNEEYDQQTQRQIPITEFGDLEINRCVSLLPQPEGSGAYGCKDRRGFDAVKNLLSNLPLSPAPLAQSFPTKILLPQHIVIPVKHPRRHEIPDEDGNKKDEDIYKKKSGCGGFRYHDSVNIAFSFGRLKVGNKFKVGKFKVGLQFKP